MPPAPRPPKPERSLSFNRSRLLARAKAHEFELQSTGWNYRNREDKTVLPPNTLITGSQNVLTNTSGRVGTRKGYTLDGAADTSISSILSSFDWGMHIGVTRNLRAGFLTSALNDGKLQFRYVNSAGAVTWTNILTGLTSTSFNFTDYWDTTNSESLLLMVNGASSITEWSGGVTTFASATSNTITTQGTNTFAQNGFYTTGTHSVWIAGVAYGYTGGSGTLTLTGVTPDPTVGAYAAGTVIVQKPETTLNSALSGSSVPSTLTNDLISNLRNQIYLASLKSNSVYISKVNNYKDFSFTTPTRVVGEGARVDMDGPAVSLIPQQDRMYFSAGKDQWYETKFTFSADLTKEAFEISRLKTTSQQGAQSQGLTSKLSNNVVFLSNEPIIRTLGLVASIYVTPQLSDLSNPIVNDINSSTFTNGQIIFHKNFLYVSAPVSSRVFIFNMTDPKHHYWEAPQILPIGRFSIINGDLYGHSYNSSESYKLFTGYNDNGTFIESKATFAYNSHKIRPNSKGFTKFFIEGYITSNTTLYRDLNFDLDGCQTSLTDSIVGTDSRIVCIGTDDNSLGKFSLGKQPLGGNLNQVSNPILGPKFRVIKTTVRVPYYEYSPTFRSNGLDQQWELLAFGPAWADTSEGSNSITE